MRNLLNALGLLVLLVTAQHGAVVHELTHYTAARGISSSDGGAGSGIEVRSASVASADANCALCPVFAQVLTPAFSHAFHVPPLIRAGIQRSPEPGYDAIRTSVLAPRSRGPPASG
jgi:hypothetical protein